MLKRKTILNEINNKNLDLHYDHKYNYFYFTYSDIENDTFETREINVARLSDLSVLVWIALGKEFVNDMEYQIWNKDIVAYNEFDLDV